MTTIAASVGTTLRMESRESRIQETSRNSELPRSVGVSQGTERVPTHNNKTKRKIKPITPETVG